MFIVFSLPRSRSTWLSVFLAREGMVGHDIGIECVTPEGFAEKLTQNYIGTCETGAGFAWRLIRETFPDAKFVVIRRPARDVALSLARFGLLDRLQEMEQRARHLADISAQPDTLTVDYHTLTQPGVCAALYEFCTGQPLDPAWWAKLDPIRIEVDMARELQRGVQHQAEIAILKAEVARRLEAQEYVIGPEAWGPELWREAEALGMAHFQEVDGGVEPKRKFKLDTALMAQMYDVGMLKVIVARQHGQIVGYYTWNVMPDVESAGLLIAQQGAWFLAPGHPRIAIRMFRSSIKTLKAFGVQCVYPHHRTQGRGAALGRFFQRQGAKEIQRTYSLWIGE